VRLLVTRPQPDAERTAAVLRARGHDVVVAPLLRIEAVQQADIGSGPFSVLLVTSANAAAAMAGHTRLAQLRALPVFAVGDRTAAAMRAVGFTDVTSARGDVGDLAALVATRCKPGGSLLYLAGADRSGDLAGMLSGRGFAVKTALIYRAVATGVLPPAALAAMAEGIGGVLHFSRRTSQAYVDLVRAGGLPDTALTGPVHFCISARAAEPLIAAGAADAPIASEPTETALLALIPEARA
jgi:uroporphyrinogen-III synthase